MSDPINFTVGADPRGAPAAAPVAPSNSRELMCRNRLVLLRGELLRIPAEYRDDQIFSYQLPHGAWEFFSRADLTAAIASAEAELVYWQREAAAVKSAPRERIISTASVPHQLKGELRQ
jgi:hypothetical protein